MNTTRRIAAAAAAILLVLIVAYEVSVEPVYVKVLNRGEGSPIPAHLVTDTIYHAEYNASTGTTTALTSCDHWHCEHAIRIRGDARDLGPGDIVLTGPRRLHIEMLDEPIMTFDGRNVSTVVAGVFDARPLSHHIWYVSGLVGGLVAATALATARPWILAAVGGPLAALSTYAGTFLWQINAVTYLGYIGFALWGLLAVGIGLPGRWRTVPGLVVMATLAAAITGAAVFHDSFAPVFTD